MCCSFSIFDGNSGGNGATLNLGFSNGRFEDVTFQNHRGSVIRVSDTVYIINEISRGLYLTVGRC